MEKGQANTNTNTYTNTNTNTNCRFQHSGHQWKKGQTNMKLTSAIVLSDSNELTLEET